jgi:two-component system response regulator DevR
VSSPPAEKKAVLVDQHPLWLETVEQLLGRIGVKVVGKATRPSRALVLVDELLPDLLVTEIKMPDGEIDGITLVRQAVKRSPDLKPLVLSMYDDQQHIEASFTAGAVAYVLKTAHPDDLASAIRQAFDHSIYLAGARPGTVHPEPIVDDAPGLTRRELEILQLVAEGHSNAQLAKMLWVTEQTVKFHLSNIYRKLDVSNRTEASRWAQLRGLLAESAIQATA